MNTPLETSLHEPFQCTNCGKWKVNINGVQYVTNSRVVKEDYEGTSLWVTFNEEGTPLFSTKQHPSSQERWKVIHVTPLEPTPIQLNNIIVDNGYIVLYE